jgi:DNA-binding protein HU-beta
MTKADIVGIIKERISNRHKFAKRDTSLKVINLIIENFFDVIKENTAKGEHIELRGFGSFESKIVEAKTIIAPRTREPLNITKHATPVFKAGRDFKKIVREYFEKNLTN